MKDRRKEVRPSTKLQMLSVVGGLIALDVKDMEAALIELYTAQPMRWQLFMDEAQVLIEASSVDRSGFPATIQSG